MSERPMLLIDGVDFAALGAVDQNAMKSKTLLEVARELLAKRFPHKPPDWPGWRDGYVD